VRARVCVPHGTPDTTLYVDTQADEILFLVYLHCIKSEKGAPASVPQRNCLHTPSACSEVQRGKGLWHFYSSKL